MTNKNCSSSPKNKIATLLLVAALPLFLTACTITETLSGLPVIGKFFGGGGSSTNTGPADLTVWNLWENPEVMRAVADKFIEQNPNVTVNIDDRSVIKPLVDYKERVFLRAEDPDGPDIVRVHISWVPQLRSLLVPMPSGQMDAQTFANAYYPVAARNLIFDNQIYGIPAYYDGLVLVYNKDHFESIGQLEAPTAWEEFRRLALELTLRGENNQLIRGGAAMGNTDNIDFSSDILGMLFSQAQVNFPNDVDGQAAQDALSFYTNFVKEDGVWSNSMPEASAAFAQEKVSMIFVPVWNLLDILAARPDLNIGVAPVPQALPNTPATWASFWVDVVPKSSKSPEAAWAFLNFMAQEEQQLFMYSEASKYRRYGAPFSLVTMKDELSSNPYLKPLLDSAPYANTNLLASRAGNRRQEDAIKAAINSVLNGSSVSGALSTAKTELSR